MSVNINTFLIDSVTTGSITYIGEAEVNVGITEAKWRLMKVDKSACGTQILYANGITSFCHTWEGRSGYTYDVTGV